jgi:hypothetical protein
VQKKSIKVQLIGGLGNQLFTYFFGVALAEYHQTSCVFSRPYYPKGLTDHNVSIESFELSQKAELSSNTSEKLMYWPRRVLDFLVRRLKFKFIDAIRTLVLREKTSHEVGYDEKFWKVKPGLRLRGYFQSYKYFEYYYEQSKLPKLKLRSPSDWFAEISDIAKSEKPIFMHIRRGDSVAVAELFGLLSSKYYIDAILLLRSKGFSNRIWIVTDEVNLAKTMLLDDLSLIGEANNIKWVEPPYKCDPAESLMLMTLGCAIVIANSTFSWWAAMLGDTKRTVISPSPWFEDREEPKLLIPENWHRLKSHWENIT